MLSQLQQLIDRTLSGVAVAQRLIAFWGPVTDASGLVAPLLAIASVLMLALLTGIAVGSLGTLIVALMVLYLLLTEVFGVSFDVNLA
jgi:hypothetical protein